MQSCKTCKWLDVPLDTAGRRRVNSNKSYPCSWPMPETYKYPDSVTKAFNYRIITDRYKMFMTADMGKTCPCWEKL